MNLKRVSSLLIVFSLLFASIISGVSFAGKTLEPSKVLAYHKANVRILFNEEEMGFFDAGKNPVYPINYNGTTYIPLRGVSALMGENIEWEALSQFVFIGKTLSQPYKGTSNQIGLSQGNLLPYKDRPAESIISVYLKPDVMVMYDFEQQTFKDVNERTVYPIIYKGSTYLPVRSVSALMEASIEWNSETQTVSISKEIVVPEIKSEVALALEDLFNQSVELYNQSTAKIGTLKDITDQKTLETLSKGLTQDYNRAKDNHNLIKSMSKMDYSDEEIIAYDSLKSFLELAEYYTLILESIAYMAASGEDYSMFEETFITFSTESAAKIDEVRKAIEAL